MEGPVQINVEDQRPRPDAAMRDHIFEPFISSKNTVGVGMGLTVARHALRNMGGEVTMTDRQGGGACAVLMVIPIEKRTPQRSRMSKIAFLGAGNMAAAMVDGLLARNPAARRPI
jgi:K+-sensing histidine kinase KdpD